MAVLLVLLLLVVVVIVRVVLSVGWLLLLLLRQVKLPCGLPLRGLCSYSKLKAHTKGCLARSGGKQSTKSFDGSKVRWS